MTKTTTNTYLIQWFSLGPPLGPPISFLLFVGNVITEGLKNGSHTPVYWEILQCPWAWLHGWVFQLLAPIPKDVTEKGFLKMKQAGFFRYNHKNLFKNICRIFLLWRLLSRLEWELSHPVSLDLGDFWSCLSFMDISVLSRTSMLGLLNISLGCLRMLLLQLAAPQPASVSITRCSYHSLLPPGSSPAGGHHLGRILTSSGQRSYCKFLLHPGVRGVGTPTFDPPLAEERAATSVTLT